MMDYLQEESEKPNYFYHNMETLTQEQIKIAQTFSESLKNDYNQLRTNGIPIQEAFSIVSKSQASIKPEEKWSKKLTNTYEVLFDSKEKGNKSLYRGLDDAAKEAFTGGIREIKEINEKYGTRAAIERAPLSILSGVGRGVGQAWGSVFETADDLTGQVVSGAVKPIITKALETERGQNFLKNAQFINEKSEGIFGDLLDVSNLITLKPFLGKDKTLPAKQIRQYLNQGGSTTFFKDPTTGVFRSSDSVFSGSSEAVKGATTRLKDLIRKPFETNIIVPETIVSPLTFKEAISRGFTPQDARIFSNLLSKDKIVAKEMLKIAEDVSTGSIDATNRSIDVLGRNIEKRLTSVDVIQKKLGAGVDEAAKALKGVVVDDAPLKENILNTIKEYGIRPLVDKKGIVYDFNFDKSIFKLTKDLQRNLKEAFNYSLATKKEAFDIHRIKKTLDVLLKGGKQGEGIVGEAKTLIQTLRRNVDDFLDTSFPSYDKANSEFRKVKIMIDEVDDILGNFDEASLSNRIRRTLGQSPNRKAITNTMAKLDKLAIELGLEDIGNVYNQALFAENLVELFGEQAITGFGKQIENAITRAKSISAGIKNPLAGIGSIIGEGVDILAGQRTQDKIQFLKNLLK